MGWAERLGQPMDHGFVLLHKFNIYPTNLEVTKTKLIQLVEN